MENSNYLKEKFGLASNTALVTGAARGIGLAIASAFGQAGARVIVNDLDPTTCDLAVKQLQAEGTDAIAASFDVSNDDSVQDACYRLAERGWPVDILISNAGIQNRKALIDMSPEEWQALQNVHVNGAFHCVRAMLPGMMSRGFGRIVLMSSVAAQATMPHLAAYSAAKSGLSALARSIAVEYGAYGVTANAIAPGFVRTGFTEALQVNGHIDTKIREAVPAGRWGSPDDIAPVALMLVSPAAAFINGQTLAIDGGLLARI